MSQPESREPFTALFVRCTATALTDPPAGGGNVRWGERDLDVSGLSSAVEDWLTDPDLDLVLLVSGAGLQSDPGALALLRDPRAEPLPGFGEGLRARLGTTLGPRSMLVTAAAARIAGLPVFAVPPDAQVVSVAWGDLISAVAHELVAAADSADEPVVPKRVRPTRVASEVDEDLEGPVTIDPSMVEVIEFGAGEPPPEPDEAAPLTGWRAGLVAVGGTLVADSWPDLPDIFDRVAPVRNVLEGAGERRLVTSESGRRWVACGYPDLMRPNSKVLLVREADPFAEVIALHRFPRRVGIPSVDEDDTGFLPSADLDPGPIAESAVGRRPPGWGQLFAVEGDAVYIERDGQISRWDGRREVAEGTRSQAMATLVLRWSQR